MQLLRCFSSGAEKNQPSRSEGSHTPCQYCSSMLNMWHLMWRRVGALLANMTRTTSQKHEKCCLAWQQHTEHTALVVAAACGHKGAQRVPGQAEHRGLMLPPDQFGSPPVVVALVEADADCLGAAACSTGCGVHSGTCQTG